MRYYAVIQPRYTENLMVEPLPKDIKSMEDAIQYVLEDRENGAHEGQLDYYGRENVITASILEVNVELDIDMEAVRKGIEEANARAEREKDEAAFEALKKKLGK